MSTEAETIELSFKKIKGSIVGFSSHGMWCSLPEILELEWERMNEPFALMEKEHFQNYSHFEAIWVTRTPEDAFKYCIPASEFEMTKEELERKYPNYKDSVYKIDLEDVLEVIDTDDGDNGFLVVKEVS